MTVFVVTAEGCEEYGDPSEFWVVKAYSSKADAEHHASLAELKAKEIAAGIAAKEELAAQASKAGISSKKPHLKLTEADLLPNEYDPKMKHFSFYEYKVEEIELA